jgi:hypothetical protein
MDATWRVGLAGGKGRERVRLETARSNTMQGVFRSITGLPPARLRTLDLLSTKELLKVLSRFV